MLAVLVSLALPWWGLTIEPFSASSYWGLFFGSQYPQTNVDFSLALLNAAFAGSYAIMTILVVLTGLSTAIGAVFKKTLMLKISLLVSVIAILAFLLDVIVAVSGSCDNFTIEPGTSCISGLVGQGASGVDVVTWGFQAGFYTFVVSTILLIGTLALQTSKSRY